MFLLKEEENGNWNIFRVVDDQSHHHPIGNARQFWAADVLTVKDHEIEQLEDLYRPKVKEAAQVIRKEYEKHVE